MRRPPAAAVVARLLRCSSPCCAACLCVCSRRRAPCPPLGGVRAPLPAAPLCGAVAGFRGASAAAAASRSVPRGGAAPRAVAPPSFAAPCSPSGCCASLRPRSPSGCAGLLLSCPLRGLRPPLWSLRSLRGVLAPLRPRRAAAFGGVAVRPRGGGAVPPSAPCSRVSPPSGASPRRFRSASPVACRRRAASARVAPAVPARRCGGLRRSGGRGGAFGGRCGGRLLWRFAPPAWGLGVAPLRRRFFSRLLLRAALPALLVCLAFGCGLLRTLSAALLPRGLFAPSARFVVQGENWMQGAAASATYCADYSLDIPYTGEFGKTRIILPNCLWISSIDTALRFWYAHIRNRGVGHGLYGCAAGAARLFDLS